MVIVGAGQSGVAAAFELRHAGWQGSITLIGDEVHLTYERPPLSKELLADNFQPVFLFTEPDFVRANITRVRDHVARILPDEHLVTMKTGGSVEYLKLLLASVPSHAHCQFPLQTRLRLLHSASLTTPFGSEKLLLELGR